MADGTKLQTARPEAWQSRSECGIVSLARQGTRKKRQEGRDMSLNDDLRVATPEKLRQLADRARKAGLELTLTSSVLAAVRADSYNIVRVKQAVRCGVASYYRVVAVIELTGDASRHEVTFDVLPEDWRALPTIREFDERLDRVEAALARTELPGAPLSEVLR
jgi:hypothetical protein